MPSPGTASGKVLDASALAAWITGSLAMDSWFALASELYLTLLVPAAARTEALLAYPEQGDRLEVLLADPSTVVAPDPGSSIEITSRRIQQDTGIFDPLATWVTAICRQRAWPALSSDPGRLRRIDPDLAVDLL